MGATAFRGDTGPVASAPRRRRPAALVLPETETRGPLVVRVTGDHTGLLTTLVRAAGGRPTAGIPADVVIQHGCAPGARRRGNAPGLLIVIDHCPFMANAALVLVEGGDAAGVLCLDETVDGLLDAVWMVSRDYRVVSPGATCMAGALQALSERRRDVLAMVLEGVTNPVMAKRLQVSTSTVKRELAALFEHFGVGSRTELMAALLGDLGPRALSGDPNGPLDGPVSPLP